MRRNLFLDEKGQNMVVLVGSFFMLIAVLAVAVDAGNWYLVRRKQQNAADAGALAGAQELCVNTALTGGALEARAEQVALDYAHTNLAADDPSLTTADADMGNYHVDVVAGQHTPTLVAGLLGFNNFDISAGAAAACGDANGGCGLWPIAFDKTMWDGLVTSCTSDPEDEDPKFYVWAAYHNDADLTPNEECRTCCETSAEPELCEAIQIGERPRRMCVCEDAWDKKAPDCDVCDCQHPRSPADDIEVITDVGRAWLDFSTQAVQQNIYPVNCDPSTGCGANELACWIQDDFNGNVIFGEDGICIDGDTGVKAGVKDEITDRSGDVVQIPLFDGPCEEERCADAFNVVQLGCIRVAGWEHTVKLDFITPPERGNPVCWKGKLIKVSVECAGCPNTCAGTAGNGPPTPGGARGISLIR
jgi:hypothetical protein